jgi:hypothetical protein
LFDFLGDNVDNVRREPVQMRAKRCVDGVRVAGAQGGYDLAVMIDNTFAVTALDRG